MSPSEIKQILQVINIRPDAMKNDDASKAVFVLLQLVECLNQENEILKIENQKLRDENNLLKGEQGKPNVRGKKKGDQGDVSSESERKKREKKEKRKPKTKKDKIKIDRTEICKVNQSELPNDAEFKGYETIVVQEILIITDNVEYKREKYYSPSENKTYLGELPIGVKGEFGPGVRSLVCTLKYVGNMWEICPSQKCWNFLKMLEFSFHNQRFQESLQRMKPVLIRKKKIFSALLWKPRHSTRLTILR